MLKLKRKERQTDEVEVSESELIKALEGLESEAGIRKGDKTKGFEDPEGGLATEGKRISGNTSEGEEDSESVGKALRKTGRMAKNEESSEDSESDDTVSKALKKKMKKQMPPMAGKDDESSSEDASGEDASSEDESSEDESMGKGGEDATSSPERGTHETTSGRKKTKKSFQEDAEENETISKAIEVSGFMEELVSLTGDHVDQIRKSVIEGQEEQSSFNNRMRKAVVAIGNTQLELKKSVDALTDALKGIPTGRGPEGKSVLHKSMIHERSFGGSESDGGNDKMNHTDPNHRKMAAEWLFQKALKGEIPHAMVTAYESNLSPLPDEIRKAMESDLFKAA